VVLGAIEDCQREGVVRMGDAHGLALAAWATVHGLAWLVVAEQLAVSGTPGDTQEVTRATLRVLLKGLGAKRAATSA
jgi:hypothetical protein